jgi:hypothetical protein
MSKNWFLIITRGGRPVRSVRKLEEHGIKPRGSGADD